MSMNDPDQTLISANRPAKQEVGTLKRKQKETIRGGKGVMGVSAGPWMYR